MVKTVDQLYENISLFSASKMALAKLRTPTVLEENARKNLGILLSNSIADLSSKTPTLMTSKSGKKSTSDHERGVRPRQESPIYKREAIHRR